MANTTIKYKQLLDEGEPFYPMVGKSSYSEWVGYEEVDGTPPNENFVTPIANGGTGETSLTDVFKIVEARYPTSGTAVFQHAQNVTLTATIPDGYGLLFVGQLQTNGFVGAGYVLTPPHFQTGNVGLGAWMSLRDGSYTGYVTAQCLCVKLR